MHRRMCLVSAAASMSDKPGTVRCASAPRVSTCEQQAREWEERKHMSSNCGLLAIVSMIVSIVAGVPTAIRGWHDLI